MTQSLVSRIQHFLFVLPRRLVSGLKFRVFYLRESRFTTPRKVRIGNKSISIQFPQEPGVSADFLDCFILNSYGLGDRLGEVKTILDVGANLGFFSIAARHYYPDAVIHAYEPNPRTLRHLRANTSQANVVIHPEAVGATNGFVTIIDEGSCNAAQTRATEFAEEAIPRVSLETAIRRIGSAVDLLKLDVEGEEWSLFQLDQSSWSSIRNVRLEYHLFHHETAKQATEAIDRLGFVICHLETKDEQFGIIWASRMRNEPA